jgi:hypothetical protein
MASWEFEPIPAPLVDAVRAEVPMLVSSVADAVSAESGYGRVLSSPEGLGIRLGIEQAVIAFLDGVQRGEHPSAGTGELWRRLGEAEFQAGRDLELLRIAFRAGTRALWREASNVAAATELPVRQVLALAEAIFLYSDELASGVVEGYLRAQSDDAGELERRRRRVAALLSDPDGVDLDVVARAATLARWPLPRAVAVLALGAQSVVPVTRRLESDVLVGSDGDGVFLVLADPDGPGRRATIARAVAGESCALGPTVEPRRTRTSLRWSRWLLGLSERGMLVPVPPDFPGGPGTLAVEDHLADLMVLRDPELAGALVSARLGPLAGLERVERDRLEETLAAWLAHQRHTPTVAAQLHVHPQTVRYRIAKLRELLGGGLESAQGRFELELALRVRAAQR